jgi:predicted ester cyclase
MIAERDEVVVHWTANGTQQGQFLGIPPTRKTASVSGTSIYRIKNQKIVEQFADWNLLTLLEQLGAATAPRAQATAR